MTVKPIMMMFLLALPVTASGQQITGLWEIKEVMVGTHNLTPVAKWTRINENHTFQSGNGWLQNSEGTWTFEEDRNLYSAVDPLGIKDEFGPFSVTFRENSMIWEREEEGQKVVVSLEKTNEIPMSTADLLQGLWELRLVSENGKNITGSFDPSDKFYLFIRWDRIYVERNAEGERSTGYWHINGHRPELTFLSHREGTIPETWTVKVSETKLILTGISDSNSELEMELMRIHQFPE